MNNHQTNPDNSAYPRKYDDVGYGLTKREYFAAIAMQGFLANGKELANHDNREIANYAVCQADALIESLNNIEK
jgi:hypothetical protein